MCPVSEVTVVNHHGHAEKLLQNVNDRAREADPSDRLEAFDHKIKFEHDWDSQESLNKQVDGFKDKNDVAICPPTVHCYHHKDVADQHSKVEKSGAKAYNNCVNNPPNSINHLRCPILVGNVAGNRLIQFIVELCKIFLCVVD